MSRFHELCRPGKCAVCGRQTDVVVCASSMEPISFAYCDECFSKELEPYDAMVAYISTAGRFPDDIAPAYQERCRHVLRELGIEESVFIADVNKSRADDGPIPIFNEDKPVDDFEEPHRLQKEEE